MKPPKEVSTDIYAVLAQLVEHSLGMGKVSDSISLDSTRIIDLIRLLNRCIINT